MTRGYSAMVPVRTAATLAGGRQGVTEAGATVQGSAGTQTVRVT